MAAHTTARSARRPAFYESCSTEGAGRRDDRIAHEEAINNNRYRPIMRTSFFMAAMLLLALTTQACHDGSLFPIDPNPDKPDPDSGRLTVDKIIGTQWKLQSIETIGAQVTPVPGGEIYTLNVSDRTSLGGIADCNTYGASYTAGANYSIALDAYTMTNAYCGDQSIDQQYMKALNAATSYYATAETLRVFYGGTGVLNFVKFTGNPANETSSPITAMPGVQWKLIAMEARASATGNGSYALIGGGEDFSLMISDAGTISGKANCNTYFGSYATGAGFAFTTIGIGSTKMGCKLINDLEVTYYGALESAESATIFSQDGKIRLEIGYDNGSKILHFEGNPLNGVPTTLSDVIGVRWQLGAIATNGGGLRGPLTSDPNMIPTLTFGANGILTGTGYCSLFTAHYEDAETATGNALGITDLDWPTTVLCPLDESEYHNALPIARSYEINGDELFIRGDNDMMMVFVRK